MRRGIVYRIVLALVAVGCVTTASALYFTQRAAFEQNRQFLAEITRVTAALISSIADFDASSNASDIPTDAGEITLDQVRRAVSGAEKIGETGEILVLRDDGQGSLEVLVHQYLAVPGEAVHRDRLPKSSPAAEPYLAGLAGKTGTSVIDGHNDDHVLVAYAPVPGKDWVIATEIELAELREPFLDAAIPVLVIAGLTAAFGAVFAYRQTANVINALEEEEQKFQKFAESASDWFWMQDKDFRFVSLGIETGQDVGFSEESVIGRLREDFAAEDTTTEKWRRLRADLEARRPFRNFIYELRRSSGPPLTISTSGIPLFDKNGNFTGYLGTGEDLSPILHRDRMLAAAEERLRVTFDAMTVGVIVIDTQGIIRFFNPKAQEMFGYSPDEVMDKNISMLMPEPDRTQHDGYIRAFRTTGHRKIIGIGREVRGQRKDGSAVPLHLGVSELELNGKPHFIGALTDLTKIKILEAQLRRAVKLDAIGQLGGGIAHDFNNLLGIVLGNLELLQRDFSPEEKSFKRAGKAIAAAQRGAALTRHLLNFSRQTPEKRELAPVDINETISELKDLLSILLRANITLRIDLANELPLAHTEKGEFNDSLVNLAVNARDAMPDGGTLSIETSLVELSDEDRDELGLRPGSYVLISMSDTGCGMSKATLERIFEPFFTTKGPGQGTGLGLPSVYGLAKRSGGQTAVTSEEGVGTTFRIYLPAVADPAPRKAEEPEDHAQTAIGDPDGSHTILVVDDESDLVELARSNLQESGYRVLATASPEEAKKMLAEDTPIDLLLTDVVMPGGIGGVDLAEAASSLRPGLRILFTSGFAGQHFDPASLTKWGGDLLPKPYSKQDLLHAVRKKLSTTDVI